MTADDIHHGPPGRLSGILLEEERMPGEKLNRPLTERFDRALSLASELHRHQSRKTTQIPYVAHLLAVAAIALEHGATEDEAIAALLHDAVEDQGGAPTLARIREEFGDAVAAIVDACSDTDVTPKPPWRERKLAYIAAVAHKSRSARLVSAADKLHNARSVVADYRTHGEALWSRFRGGRATVGYYRALLDAFVCAERAEGASALSTLLAELERVVDELEALAGLSTLDADGDAQG